MTVTDEMIEAYMRAVFANWWIDLRRDELVPDVRAGLTAVLPLLRVQVCEEIARAIESAAATDRTPRLVGHDAVQLWDGRQFAYDHSAALARAARVPDCGDQYHGADGGPCQGCGFDVTEKG